MSGWRGVGWRKIEYHRIDFFLQYLKDSISTPSNMFLKVCLWKPEVSGNVCRGSWSKQNCISWVKSMDVLFPKETKRPAHVGPIQSTRVLEAARAARSFYSSSLPSCVPRGKQDCLNWPQNRWPAGQPLSTPFVQMSERFETVFLSREEGPIWISSCSSQALWVGSGTERWVTPEICHSPWWACLLPWGDIKYIVCWTVCIFSLPKASWTD